MGEDQLKEKIRNQIDRGINSECEVVYLLVEIRKLMDRDKKNTAPYNSLRLYIDWAVHIDLKGPEAQDIVKRADAFYPSLLNGTVSAEEKTKFSTVFLLKTFREEIDRFLRDHVQRSFVDASWNKFLTYFLHVIEDCPLICKPDNAKLNNVDEVFVFRDGGKIGDSAEGGSPPIKWDLYHKGKLKRAVDANFATSDKLTDALAAASGDLKPKGASS